MLPDFEEAIELLQKLMEIEESENETSRLNELMESIHTQLRLLDIPMPSPGSHPGDYYLRLIELRRMSRNGMLELAKGPKGAH